MVLLNSTYNKNRKVVSQNYSCNPSATTPPSFSLRRSAINRQVPTWKQVGNYLLSPLMRPQQKLSYSQVGMLPGYESINYLLHPVP